MGILSKTTYRIKLKRYFKLVEDFLVDGYYRVEDKKIIKINRSDMPFFERFKVKSKSKKIFEYHSGSLFFTQYKSGLLTNDKAFYFINKKGRYDLYKKNYCLYKDQLRYPSLDLDFFDDRTMVVGPIVPGTIYKDLSHFDIYLQLLFDYANDSSFEYKDSLLSENSIKLPWYVQHGDCKNANIVWQNDNKFMMIDLEAIDFYPPLYDVFYYMFITKKESSVDVLKSDSFLKKVKTFFDKKIPAVPDNILDICLANYAYFTTRNLVKGCDLYEFEFYLFWRKYDSFELFPLTKKVLDEYQEKLSKYGIK